MKHLEVLKFEERPNSCVHQIWVHLKEVVLKMEKLHVLLSLVLSLLVIICIYFLFFTVFRRKKNNKEEENTP